MAGEHGIQMKVLECVSETTVPLKNQIQELAACRAGSALAGSNLEVRAFVSHPSQPKGLGRARWVPGIKFSWVPSFFGLPLPLRGPLLVVKEVSEMTSDLLYLRR